MSQHPSDVLHKEIPFLRICVPLCAGIISGLYISPVPSIYVVAGIIISILFLIGLRADKYSGNLYFGTAMSFSLFLAGLILYRNEKDNLSVLEPKTAIFVCELSEYPEEKPASFLLKVRLKSVTDDSGSFALKGSMLIYLEKDEDIMSFVPGDKIVVKCKPGELANRGNPEEFNYRFYMENLGIKYSAFSRSKDLLLHSVPEKRKLIHQALIIRRKIIRMYSLSGISDERLPLVSALTLGEKSNLDQEQKEIFIKAGIMHIMAVSGLHAVILSIFVLNTLYFLKRRFNFLRILIAILFIWSFAFVTGLTPSVMRATLMFTFIQAGNLMHRRANGINSVLASAFVLIIIRPSVIFNAGFLLSYSAVIFIIAFYRDLYLRFHSVNKLTDWVWQSVAVTLVAQAGTLPLTIMFFNRFPVYFILTNLIIVPLSSVAIILGCLIPVFYPVGFISGLLGLALDKLTGLILFLTGTAASLPFSGIENIGMTALQGIFLFCSLTMMMYFVLGNKRRSPLPLLFLFAMYIAAGAVKEIRTRSTSELIVYNTRDHPVTGIRKGKILNLYSDTAFIPPEVLRHSSTLGLKTLMHNSSESRYLKTEGKTVLIGNQEGYIVPSETDFIVSLNSFPLKTSFPVPPEREVSSNTNPGGEPGKEVHTVILTGNIRKVPQFWHYSGSQYRIHSIRESGAFVTRL